MKKSNYTIYILLFALVFTFCKKKDKDPVATSSTPSTPSLFDSRSILQTTYYTSEYFGTTYSDSSALAIFFDQPMSVSTKTQVSAGAVIFNDSTLYFSFGSYSSYFPVNLTVPQRWSVSGSSFIPGFSYTVTPSFPQYSGQSSLPDSCYKSSGLTININGVTNFSGSAITLFLNNTSGSAVKSITGNGVVVFTPSDLSSFTVGTAMTLQIVITNYHTATLGGLVHSFAFTRSHQKGIWLK